MTESAQNAIKLLTSLHSNQIPTKFRKWGAWHELNFERGWPFRGGDCNFYIKDKLKSEIFNDKKVYKQKYFSVLTENSNWETLTKNLVIFER